MQTKNSIFYFVQCFFVENNSILNDVMPFENKTTNNKRVQPFSNKLGISDEIEVQREFLIFFFL